MPRATSGAAALAVISAAAAAALIPGWYGWWVGLWSLLTALVYAIDKSAAERGRRRISERQLLMLSLLGGWPGALAAQDLFRHKRRKVPFQRLFLFSIVLHHVAAVGILGIAQFAFNR